MSGDVGVVPVDNILLPGRTTYFLALDQIWSKWSKWSKMVHGLGVILNPSPLVKVNVFLLVNIGALLGITILMRIWSKWSKLLRKHPCAT